MAPTATRLQSQVGTSTSLSAAVAPAAAAMTGVKTFIDARRRAPVSAGMSERPYVLQSVPARPIAPSSPAARYTELGTRLSSCS